MNGRRPGPASLTRCRIQNYGSRTVRPQAPERDFKRSFSPSKRSFGPFEWPFRSFERSSRRFKTTIRSVGTGSRSAKPRVEASKSRLQASHRRFEAAKDQIEASQWSPEASKRSFESARTPSRGDDLANRRLAVPVAADVKGSATSTTTFHKEKTTTRFPQTEPEIAALALVMVQGLAQAGDEFPVPPVAVTELQARLAAETANPASNAGDSTRLRVSPSALLIGGAVSCIVRPSSIPPKTLAERQKGTSPNRS